MSSPAILAIDQGTTSSRAILFDRAGHPQGIGQAEFPQIYPAPGLVEHDAETIWRDTLQVMKTAVARSGRAMTDVAAIGITNQRETTVIWERDTGRPIHNAIVWQDRRTADRCARMKAAGAETVLRARSGLVLDPYFSASKIAWILDSVPGARAAAVDGRLAFGTIDSFLLWRLTGGRVHATDASNAARTALFNIHSQQWDDELLRLFDVPAALLPTVADNAGRLGETAPGLLDRAIAITGMAGDQQAALLGQAAIRPGLGKATYGTGCFAVVNTGDRAVASTSGLLTTVAWRLGGRTTYALEGSLFIAGAAVKWLRDKLGIIDHAAETERIFESTPDSAGVVVVPAFAGLGTPHWDAEARAAILGLSLDSGRDQIIRATLEAIGYQSADLAGAFTADMAGAGLPELEALRVDGGMVVNNALCQFIADVIGRPVERPQVTETTALGAAFLAGLGAGLYDRLEDMESVWRAERGFVPHMPAEERRRRLSSWSRAVARVRSGGRHD